MYCSMRPHDILERHVAVQALQQQRAHLCQQLRARLRDASAQNDAPWRRRQHDVVQQLRQRVRDGVPNGAVGGHLLRRDAGARRNRGPRRQALDAITVQRA